MLARRAGVGEAVARLLQVPEVDWLRRWRTPIFGGAALAVGAFGQFQAVGLRHPEQATPWYVLAALFGIISLSGSARPVPLAPPVAVPPRRRALAVAGIALALLLSAVLLATVKADGNSPAILWIWGAGLVVYLVALSPLPRFDSHALVETARTFQPGTIGPALRRLVGRLDPDLLGLAVVVAAAVAANFIAIDAFPTGIHSDESEIGWQARRIMAGERIAPFGGDWIFGANLLFYAQALFLWLAGDNLIGLRAFAAFSGTLSVVFLWLFARLCFGGRLATIAGLLLAFSPVHVHFSRSGHTIHASFATSALLYFLARGLARGRSLDFALAGIAAGLGAILYHAGRILPVALVVALVVLAVRHPRRIGLYGRGLFLGLVGLWLTVGPYIYPATAPAHLWDRSENVSVLSAAARNQLLEAHRTRDWGTALVKQAEATASAFFWRQDNSEFYPFPGDPLLASAESVLFVAGLAYLTWNWSFWPFLLIAVLFWSTFVGSVLTTNPPIFTRLLSMLPMAYVAVAWPVVYLLLGGRVPVRRFARPVLAGVAVVLVAVLAVGGIQTTFVKHAQQYPWPYASSIVRYLLGLGTNVHVYLMATPLFYYDYGPIKFVARGVPGESLHNLQAALPPADEPARASIYLVHPALDQYLPLLRSVFPGGREEPVSSPKGERYLTAFRVSPEQVLEQRGFLAQPTVDGKPGQATVVRPAGTTAERLCAPAPTWPATVRWNALLHVTESGPYGFRLAGRTAGLWLDGAPAAAPGGVVPRPLMRGFHRLVVEATMQSAEDCPTLRWVHPKRGEEPIPLRSLLAVDAEQGLRARVVPQAQGAPVERVDRFVGFRDAPVAWDVPGAFTVTWDGAIDVPTNGQYLFEVFSAGNAAVEIDGRPVLAHPPRDGVYPVQAPVQLTGGRHRFRMTYTWPGRGWDAVELIWTPPGGPRQIIPPGALWRPSP